MDTYNDENPTQLSSSSQVTRLSKKPKGGHPWLWAAIALLVVAAVAGGIYYFTNQEKSRHHAGIDDEDDEMETEDEDNHNLDDEADDDTYVMGREHNDEEEEEEEEEASAPPVRDANAPQTLTLSGDADGYPLTLTLQVNANGRITGTYKDDSQGTTLQLSGTKAGDAMRLEGRSGQTTYTFRIVPDGRLFTGILNAGGASRELHLTERR